MTTYPAGGPSETTTTTYKYDERGLRVEQAVGGVTTKFLFDTQNFTGYAQVLEQLEQALSSDVKRTFTLGLDVLAQFEQDHMLLTFLYDGHGSTRGVINQAGVVPQWYAYDAYGVMLKDTNNVLTTAAGAWVSHLYAGEQFDHRTGLGYNRARYYDPRTGRFNRVDPWAGNTSDPQSLHKYLYAHANPVMGVDPSGLFTLAELGSVQTIVQILSHTFRLVSTVARAYFKVQSFVDLVSTVYDIFKLA